MSNFPLTDVWPAKRSSWSIFQYVPYQRIALFTAVVDFALICAASVISGIIYHELAYGVEGPVESYLAVGTYFALVFVLIYSVFGFYEPTRLLSAGVQIRGILLVWGAVVLFETLIFFVLKAGANYSRGATIGFATVGFGMLFASRAVIGSNLRRALANGTLAGRRVIIIGEPEQLAAKSPLDLLRDHGAREVARFELSPPIDSTSTSNHDLAIVDAGIEAARTKGAEQILLAISWNEKWRRDLICHQLRMLPLPVLLLPDRSVTSILSETDRTDWAPTAIEIRRAPLSLRDQFIKRLVDIIFASLGLLLLSPLLLVTSLAIKLDSSGPVLFRQRRRGFSSREFAIYKFRTMNVLEDGTCIRQVQRDDHRVTKLGRLLRTSSIDELPQLFNVLSGEMSLVGPRPHAIAHDDEYSMAIDSYAFRHHVKPGITGWAQIYGFRGETPVVEIMSKRIDYDLWYINNWSAWLDFRILAQTCVELLRPRNAY